MTEDQKDLHIEMLLAENKTQALILKSLESSLADFIKLNEKLRNSILKNPFSCHEIYKSIIKDFIQKNIELGGAERLICSVKLDGNSFSCEGVQRDINSDNLFNLIFNHYKNKAGIL